MAERHALRVTILHPDKLNYRVLFALVAEFRKQIGKFPDRIEFSRPLYDRFMATLGVEGRLCNEFLGVKCCVATQEPVSHNLEVTNV